MSESKGGHSEGDTVKGPQRGCPNVGLNKKECDFALLHDNGKSPAG